MWEHRDCATARKAMVTFNGVPPPTPAIHPITRSPSIGMADTIEDTDRGHDGMGDDYMTNFK